MFRALLRTATEIADSKKAAYSFLNMIGACVLHLYFGVNVQDALLLVSPLSLLTLAQALVDMGAARQSKLSPALPPFPVPLPMPSTDGGMPPVPGGM